MATGYGNVIYSNRSLLALRVVPGKTPARSRINRLLKYAGAWGIECLGFGDPAELARLRQEVIALRARLSAADSCPQKEDLPMLVLGRRVNERLTIFLPDGREIILTICATTTARIVRLGIDAPDDVRILRTELSDRASSAIRRIHPAWVDASPLADEPIQKGK